MSKNIWLLASVFVSGCAVLVVEIIATRILAPYYGNTIYTTSAVIGVILAALSVGYYVGGRFADRHLEFSYFYVTIFFSGCMIVFMQAFSGSMLPILGVLFTIRVGPLISSLLFFFAPAFTMGILSPFAVALYKKDEPGIGNRSGNVFFWSTLGSITGSLLTGFFLIPYFGINTIMLTTGCVLAVWGLVGYSIFEKSRTKIPLFVALFLASLFSIYTYAPAKEIGTLYEKDGVYEKVKVANGTWEGQPTRFLFQDRSYSAGMNLATGDLAYDYTKYYSLYRLINPKATTAFVIGGGAYSIPKALLKDSQDMHVTVAEIEPELFSLAKTYFNLTDTSRLFNVTEDGRMYLRSHNDLYDIMISDVYYSFFSIPVHFTTREFFNLAKSHLSNNGVFIGNFAGDLRTENPSFLFSEINTFKKVFPNSYFFAVNSPDSKKPQNIIFMGINGDKKIDFSSQEIIKNSSPILRELETKKIDITKYSLDNYAEITDDFAPIEYYVSDIVNHWN